MAEEEHQVNDADFDTLEEGADGGIAEDGDVDVSVDGAAD